MDIPPVHCFGLPPGFRPKGSRRGGRIYALAVPNSQPLDIAVQVLHKDGSWYDAFLER